MNESNETLLLRKDAENFTEFHPKPVEDGGWSYLVKDHRKGIQEERIEDGFATKGLCCADIYRVALSLKHEGFRQVAVFDQAVRVEA